MFEAGTCQFCGSASKDADGYCCSCGRCVEPKPRKTNTDAEDEASLAVSWGIVTLVACGLAAACVSFTAARWVPFAVSGGIGVASIVGLCQGAKCAFERREWRGAAGAAMSTVALMFSFAFLLLAILANRSP